MTSIREGEDDDIFPNIPMSKKSIKEDILDESFKKAEISKEIQTKKGKKISKEPFRKLGIVLIIISIISLAIINFLPWMYIRYDAEYGTIEEFYYRGLENKEGNYYEEVNYIFESPCINCSYNSKNYIGVTEDDFTNIPKVASNGFFALVILGLIYTIFEIIKRKYNFFMETALIIHSIYAAAAIFISIVVAVSSIKFLGIYFLLYYNMSFIEASGVNNVILIFVAPIILIFVSSAIIKISITVLKINFDEFEKKSKMDKSQPSFSKF